MTMVMMMQAMGAMNQAMNMPALQRIMMEFERQSEIMDMKDEMMQDTLDDVFEAEDEGTKNNLSNINHHHSFIHLISCVSYSFLPTKQKQRRRRMR